MNIGDLYFALRASDRTLQTDVKRAGDKAGATLGQSMSASLKRSFSGQEFGKGIVQGLGLAGALGAANLAAAGISAVADTFGDAVNAASNLNETMTKSEVIFGDNADAMSDWADTAAESFGQSKRQALDTASGFAGLFDTVGIGLDQATDMSKKLTVLGSDLASFFNTDVQTAIDALRSGLSGESEPLRRFNVFLSETAVNSKLVAMGQQKVNGQWTEGQKALARYTLILEQSTSAQGDYARTADGLANTQRELAARWEDTLARLGQVILPILTEAASFLADGLGGLLIVLDAIGEAASHLVGPLQAVVDVAKTLGLVVEEGGDRVGRSLEKFDTSRTGRKLGKGLDDLADSARSAADAVEISSTDILSAFAEMRDTIVSGGQNVADALIDPLIAAGELAETQAELRANKQRLISEELTADERAQLLLRNDQLRKSLIEQNALLLTYGTEAEQISKIKAFLASGFWAQAYEEATPEQAAALDEWRVTLTTRLDQMEGDAGAGGKAAGQAYSTNLAGQKGTVTNAATTAGSGQAGVWAYYKNQSYIWGGNVGKAYADGLRATYGLVNDAANYVASGAVGPMKASSPPGPESPLHLIDVWGKRTIMAWVDSIASGAKAARAATMSVAQAAASGLAWQAPALAYSPATSGPSVPAPTPMGQPQQARVVNENHVHIEGLVKAPDPFAIATQMERFQQTGVFPDEEEYR